VNATACSRKAVLALGAVVGFLIPPTLWASPVLASSSDKPGVHVSYDVTSVAPDTTSAAIGAPDSNDLVVIDPAARSNGELFVFLPGTGAAPDCCELILKEAASMGYAAIGLSYPNSTSVKSRCVDDGGCYAMARADEFNGSHPSAASSQSPENAVTFRLTSLLSYLRRKQPNRTWGKFLSAGTVDWPKVVIGGHSQGGGEAAYIGTVERTEGVLMLSAPEDATGGTFPTPAPYLSASKRTPSERFIGFDHTADPSHLEVTTDWSALGLGRFGDPVSVDSVGSPFRRSHQLMTSASVPDHTVSNAAHDSTAVDVDTPMCPDGSPLFAPVWRYMLQVAGGLPVSASRHSC
jgi:hypothetical protein